MSNNASQPKLPMELPKNLLSPEVRIFGLYLMAITIALALALIVWVLWNRKSSVVTMMQPVFLIMLCVGSIIQLLAIIPMGADDENTKNVDAACISFWWFVTMGSTLTHSALFSKLWRVNQIFHAQGFQRKVVTTKDVLRPFLVLFVLNTTFLLILTFVDPPTWHRMPINEQDPFNTAGYCVPQGGIGMLMIFLILLADFAGLAFLCVQAYRARDINTDFSEARGVALALFSNLQAFIIAAPTDALLDETNVDAKYTLQIMQMFVSAMSLLLFIFGPLIAHQRQHARRGSANDTSSNTRTRISGLDFDIPANATTAAGASCPPDLTTATPDPSSSCYDEEKLATITSLEMEVETLRSQVAKLTRTSQPAEDV